MLFRQLFEHESSTYTYLLADAQTGDAVLIDPVLEEVERDLAFVRELGLTLRFALDTHVHADHVTALGALRERTGCTTVLSERGGSGVADRLVKDGDRVTFGRHSLEVRETPGHTNGCITYVLDDHSMAFTGDALLVRGNGRTDFQEGDPRTLYRSIHAKIFSLPDSCLLYPGHDYKGRTATSVGEEKRHNLRIGGGKTEDEFVAIMKALVLAAPKKIDLAVPANLVGGLLRDARVTAEPVIARDWAPIVVSPGGIPEVLPEWVASHASDVPIVDVRELDEWTGPLGHVAEARLVPLATVEAVAAQWDRNAPIVLVCRSGGRSGKAALALLERGFTKVASMRGGMTRWNESRLPVAS